MQLTVWLTIEPRPALPGRCGARAATPPRTGRAATARPCLGDRRRPSPGRRRRSGRGNPGRPGPASAGRAASAAAAPAGSRCRRRSRAAPRGAASRQPRGFGWAGPSCPMRQARRPRPRRRAARRLPGRGSAPGGSAAPALRRPGTTARRSLRPGRRTGCRARPGPPRNPCHAPAPLRRGTRDTTQGRAGRRRRGRRRREGWDRAARRPRLAPGAPARTRRPGSRGAGHGGRALTPAGARAASPAHRRRCGITASRSGRCPARQILRAQTARRPARRRSRPARGHR